ncbi:condensation domain-containing protein [Streptomyces xantholiticus]
MRDSEYTPKGFYSLTAAQSYHHQAMRLDPQLRAVVRASREITGPLHVSAFLSSLSTVVAERDALRACIAPNERTGTPVQQIRAAPSPQDLISCQRVQSASREQFNRYVGNMIFRESRKEWAPGDYPFRFHLLRHSAELHAFIATFSHTMIDGRSRDIIMQDLWNIYEANAQGIPSPERRQPPQFMQAAVADVKRDANEAKERFLATPEAPPLTQFIKSSREQAGDDQHDQVTEFSITGSAYQSVQQLIELNDVSEFDWTLSAFAATIFRSTLQDVVKIYLPVDMRSASQRNVVGMFVINVPVVIERPNDERASFPKMVRASALRAIRTYRRYDPATLNRLMRSRSEAWGAQNRSDLSFNYRKSYQKPQLPVKGLDITDYGVPPRLKYSSSGVDIKVFGMQDRLRIQVALDNRSFSGRSREKMLEDLRSRIVNGRWTERSLPFESRAVEVLSDTEGRAIAHSDTNGLRDALLAHPSVISAQVQSVQTSAGTHLRAAATVSDDTSEEEIRNHLRKASSDDEYLLVPRIILISRQDRSNFS